MADLVTAFLSSALHSCEREIIICSHLCKEVWAPSKKSVMPVLWFLDWNLKHVLWQSWVLGTPQTMLYSLHCLPMEYWIKFNILVLAWRCGPKYIKDCIKLQNAECGEQCTANMTCRRRNETRESHVQVPHSMCDTHVITGLLERAQKLVWRAHPNLCCRHHWLINHTRQWAPNTSLSHTALNAVARGRRGLWFIHSNFTSI